ncbi:MAG: Coenzyme F420 hydrogenase/dehydrogenase, beta subunit C-terminal domain [Candidatus Methanofastidiosia archaeon]
MFPKGIAKGLKVTFKNLLKPEITVQYPKEKLEMPRRMRGFNLYLYDKCTGCEMCEEVCPNDSIKIYKRGVKKNPIDEYIYNFSTCTWCGLCVDVCPVRALQWLPDYEFPAFDEKELIFNREKFKLAESKNPEVVLQTLKLKKVKGSCVVAPKECIGCLLCKEACAWDAVYNVDGGSLRRMELDFSKCTYCGMCAEVCPTGTLRIEEFDERVDVESWELEIPEWRGFENYFEQLREVVIKPKLCSHCSACVNACPVLRITSGDKPIDDLKEIPCINCAMCDAVCPRYDYTPGVSYDLMSGTGDFLEILSARSKRFSGQDGAMVTEMFVSAIEMGLIDAAIVVDRDKEMHPVLKVLKNPKEIVESSGTKYSYANVLRGLKLSERVPRVRKVGLVGTPCQINGLKKSENAYPYLTSKVNLRIALFCTENFYYHDLFESFLKEQKIDAREISYTDITKGKLYVKVAGEMRKFGVKEFEDYVGSGCLVCQDFSGIFSDVSVGSIGSAKGFTTLVVRDPKVLKLIEYMKKKDYIEVSDAKKKIIDRLCEIKVKLHPYP